MHQLRSASLLVQHANLRLSRARFRGPSRDASGIRIRALIRAYKWMPGVGGYPLGPRPSAVPRPRSPTYSTRLDKWPDHVLRKLHHRRLWRGRQIAHFGSSGQVGAQLTSQVVWSLRETHDACLVDSAPKVVQMRESRDPAG